MRERENPFQVYCPVPACRIKFLSQPTLPMLFKVQRESQGTLKTHYTKRPLILEKVRRGRTKINMDVVHWIHLAKEKFREREK